MADTMEENTRWINTWAVNDPDWYGRLAQLAAAGDVLAFKDRVISILATYSPDDFRHNISQSMSEADWDNTDWSDIMGSFQ